MPSIEVTRKELEALIENVMNHRIECKPDEEIRYEYCTMLSILHSKLEDALELWINGGEVELPVPAHMKAMGVNKWTKVHPPHDEGCYE